MHYIGVDYQKRYSYVLVQDKEARRSEGLKVPKRQTKSSRLWLNDGSCIRLRPEHKDNVGVIIS